MYTYYLNGSLKVGWAATSLLNIKLGRKEISTPIGHNYKCDLLNRFRRAYPGKWVHPAEAYPSDLSRCLRPTTRPDFTRKTRRKISVRISTSTTLTTTTTTASSATGKSRNISSITTITSVEDPEINKLHRLNFGKIFWSSLLITIKGTTLGAGQMGKITNIRLGWNSLSSTNTLA